ncbi:MAG: Membrane protein [Stygiobacter sp.]|nr:MAG: Membrane protein [Stygiobacter sp.]
MKANPVILAPNGFPWRAALIGGAVIAVGVVGGMAVFPAAAVGGLFIVSALIGLAVFAASLG